MDVFHCVHGSPGAVPSAPAVWGTRDLVPDLMANTIHGMVVSNTRAHEELLFCARAQLSLGDWYRITLVWTLMDRLLTKLMTIQIYVQILDPEHDSEHVAKHALVINLQEAAAVEYVVDSEVDQETPPIWKI